MLLNCTGKFCGVAAIRPIGKERELFGLAERTEIRIVLQDFGKRAVELGAGDSGEIWQCKIVTADTEFPENAADFGTAKRGLAQHVRKHSGAFRSRAAQCFTPRGRGQHGLR